MRHFNTDSTVLSELREKVFTAKTELSWCSGALSVYDHSCVRQQIEQALASLRIADSMLFEIKNGREPENCLPLQPAS